MNEKTFSGIILTIIMLYSLSCNIYLSNFSKEKRFVNWLYNEGFISRKNGYYNTVCDVVVVVNINNYLNAYKYDIYVNNTHFTNFNHAKGYIIGCKNSKL